MENNEDQIWLDKLAGKPSKSSNKSLTLNAKLLRSAIQNHIAEEKSHDLTLEKLKNKLREQGLFESNANSSLKIKFIKLIKKFRLFFILVLALIAGTLIPVQMATRSGDESSFFSGLNLTSKDVIIKNEINITNPKMTYLIIDSAISSGLTVEIKQENKVKLITLKGLKRNDVDQVSIKAILQVPNQTSGNILIKVGGE